MAKLHHMKVKAAVAKIKPLLSGEQTEESIKATIAKEFPEYDEEGIQDIFADLVKPADPGNEPVNNGGEPEKPESDPGKPAEGSITKDTEPDTATQMQIADLRTKCQHYEEAIKHLSEENNDLKAKHEAALELVDRLMNKSEPEPSQTGGFIVVKPFRDSADFTKEYKPGQDVSHFAKDRLSWLIEAGHVEQQ